MNIFNFVQCLKIDIQIRSIFDKMVSDTSILDVKNIFSKSLIIWRNWFEMRLWGFRNGSGRCFKKHNMLINECCDNHIDAITQGSPFCWSHLWVKFVNGSKISITNTAVVSNTKIGYQATLIQFVKNWHRLMQSLYLTRQDCLVQMGPKRTQRLLNRLRRS